VICILTIRSFLVPIVTVFTKYDVFVNWRERIMDESPNAPLEDADIDAYLKKDADATMNELCVGPLMARLGSDTPYMAVSSKRRSLFKLR
jgi:hypothetical protein